MALHWRERWRQWRNQGRSQAINTGFTYHNDPTAEAPLDKNLSQTLADMPLGERVQIQGLPGPSQAKLLSMGLVPGVVVEIASRLPSGSVVVALDGQRLGLGAELAQQIAVVPYAGSGKPMKLREATVGARLRVVGYAPAAGDYKRKLLAMGLTPGTVLEVKRHAPLGDPTEILVRGFALSLRKGEADALVVEPV